MVFPYATYSKCGKIGVTIVDCVVQMISYSANTKEWFKVSKITSLMQYFEMIRYVGISYIQDSPVNTINLQILSFF